MRQDMTPEELEQQERNNSFINNIHSHPIEI
jgi:hypothetical protein